VGKSFLFAIKFSQDDIYIGGLLLRHIEQLVCNGHAITELQITQISDSSLIDSKSQERVATAIYPTTSLLNHSCDSSIIQDSNSHLWYTPHQSQTSLTTLPHPQMDIFVWKLNLTVSEIDFSAIKCFSKVLIDLFWYIVIVLSRFSVSFHFFNFCVY
jgi:hypothetical protein